MYYRARYYHAGLGRFTSRDPMGMVDAVSPYAYVANNPLNFVDPSGEFLNLVVGGGANVALGWGIAALTGSDYSFADAGRDFAIGAATSGVGTVIKAAQIARQLDRAREVGSVVGAAQKTGAIGHVTRIEYEASKALANGAETVYLNRAWSTAAGVKATPGTGLAKRPDLIAKEGNILRGVEVGSKTDKSLLLAGRLDEGAIAVNKLGNGITAMADDVIGAFGQRVGSRTYGFSPLPLTYGLGTAFTLDGAYQGLSFMTDVLSASPYSGSGASDRRPGKP